MCQCTLFDVGGVEIDSIECIEYCTKDQSNVEDIEDRKVHIRGVRLCMSKMLKMGKEHTHTFWLINFLILNGFSIRKKFWKAETESFPTIPSNLMYVKACRSMSKIDQIHLRAVMLCMSKMSKMGKEHTHTSLTSSTCFDIHRI